VQETRIYAGTVRGGHVQLAPGESDELTVHVDSVSSAAIAFKIEISYRVVNRDNVSTFRLPYLFRVTYSDPLNWHPYRDTASGLQPS
jgi:hypothetical protein